MRGDLPVVLRTFLVLITCKQRGPFKTGSNNRASLFQVLPFFNQINYFVADKNRYSLKIADCSRLRAMKSQKFLKNFKHNA